MNDFLDYKKYRWFFTFSGKLVVGGRSAAQNDELLKKLKSEKKDLVVMHTSSPGSPFAVILSEKNSLSSSDLEETAIFTGCFSRAWRENLKKTEIHIFSLSQLSKSPKMKAGSWSVIGNVQKKSVSLELVLTTQNEILRAVPKKSADKILLKVLPGKTDKTLIAEKIQKALKSNFTRQDILAALPPGGVKISK